MLVVSICKSQDYFSTKWEMSWSNGRVFKWSAQWCHPYSHRRGDDAFSFTPLL